ncbi:MAG: hypothetical protein ACXVJL_04265 [Candidatus Angelobacter sp.]
MAHLMHYLVALLEFMFLAGLAGSLVVAVLAFVGDIHEFFEKDRPEGSSQAIGD